MELETTCGLRISANPTSDNLNPQETTKDDAPDMGLDGAGLSCPGSSVVAEAEGEAARFENTSAPETIARDRFSSVELQAIADQLEEGERPIKHNQAQ